MYIYTYKSITTKWWDNPRLAKQAVAKNEYLDSLQCNDIFISIIPYRNLIMALNHFDAFNQFSNEYLI